MTSTDTVATPQYIDLSTEKGFQKLLDEDGVHICNGIPFNGHFYSPFGNNFVDRVSSFRERFTVEEDDIFLLSYVKSGTHWLWEILMMLTQGSAEPRTENKEEAMIEIASRESLEALGRPRVMNTHFPPQDLPRSVLTNSGCKLIQVHRNPKDAAVSFYDHASKDIWMNMDYKWDDYIRKLYCNDKLMPHLTWFEYTQSWWPYSKQENFLTLFYEEMVENPGREVRKIANFLNIVASDELLDAIVVNTSFTKMKQHKAAHEIRTTQPYFQPGFTMYRKGIVGDWKNHFTVAQNELFDEIYETRMRDFPELKSRIRFWILPSL